MKLNYTELQDKTPWNKASIAIPSYDWKEMSNKTLTKPTWIHFGAGNIFRGFIAGLQHQLLEQNLTDTGIIAVDTFDFELIDKIYTPFDSMTLNVALQANGSMKKTLQAGIAKGLRGSGMFPEDMSILKEAFQNPSLQMVSFTVTEKGYALQDMDGEFLPSVREDFQSGPENCKHVMSLVTALLLERFQKGGQSLALVSMDNCSKNGQKLRDSILTVAKKWQECGFVSLDFLQWLSDEAIVSFPWSMIDKITPRPASVVLEELEKDGLENMEAIVTSKNTFIAPFVNAEVPQYLVIEDRFPNGRPPLEKAGVFFTDRKTVNVTETMKVTTCLNPLHTALAVFGCLLGCKTIAEEMNRPYLRALVSGIGYSEGLPVVLDPKILSPKDFLDEVLNERLPNSFLPDTPQRIATDTSQKVAIRFGETIKSYEKSPHLQVNTLHYIPLALAGWLRYLLAVDDQGNSMECSSDPMLAQLQEQLSGISLGNTGDFTEKLRPILENHLLFGVNLMEVGLGEKICVFFSEMVCGVGAVEECLKKNSL